MKSSFRIYVVLSTIIALGSSHPYKYHPQSPEYYREQWRNQHKPPQFFPPPVHERQNRNYPPPVQSHGAPEISGFRNILYPVHPNYEYFQDAMPHIIRKISVPVTADGHKVIHIPATGNPKDIKVLKFGANHHVNYDDVEIPDDIKRILVKALSIARNKTHKKKKNAKATSNIRDYKAPGNKTKPKSKAHGSNVLTKPVNNASTNKPLSDHEHDGKAPPDIVAITPVNKDLAKATAITKSDVAKATATDEAQDTYTKANAVPKEQDEKEFGALPAHIPKLPVSADKPTPALIDREPALIYDDDEAPNTPDSTEIKADIDFPVSLVDPVDNLALVTVNKPSQTPLGKLTADPVGEPTPGPVGKLTPAHVAKPPVSADKPTPALIDREPALIYDDDEAPNTPDSTEIKADIDSPVSPVDPDDNLALVTVNKPSQTPLGKLTADPEGEPTPGPVGKPTPAHVAKPPVSADKPTPALIDRKPALIYDDDEAPNTPDSTEIKADIDFSVSPVDPVDNLALVTVNKPSQTPLGKLTADPVGEPTPGPVGKPTPAHVAKPPVSADKPTPAPIDREPALIYDDDEAPNTPDSTEIKADIDSPVSPVDPVDNLALVTVNKPSQTPLSKLTADPVGEPTPGPVGKPTPAHVAKPPVSADKPTPALIDREPALIYDDDEAPNTPDSTEIKADIDSPVSPVDPVDNLALVTVNKPSQTPLGKLTADPVGEPTLGPVGKPTPAHVAKPPVSADKATLAPIDREPAPIYEDEKAPNTPESTEPIADCDSPVVRPVEPVGKPALVTVIKPTQSPVVKLTPDPLGEPTPGLVGKPTHTPIDKPTSVHVGKPTLGHNPAPISSKDTDTPKPSKPNSAAEDCDSSVTPPAQSNKPTPASVVNPTLPSIVKSTRGPDVKPTLGPIAKQRHPIGKPKHSPGVKPTPDPIVKPTPDPVVKPTPAPIEPKSIPITSTDSVPVSIKIKKPVPTTDDCDSIVETTPTPKKHKTKDHSLKKLVNGLKHHKTNEKKPDDSGYLLNDKDEAEELQDKTLVKNSVKENNAIDVISKQSIDKEESENGLLKTEKKPIVIAKRDETKTEAEDDSLVISKNKDTYTIAKNEDTEIVAEHKETVTKVNESNTPNLDKEKSKEVNAIMEQVKESDDSEASDEATDTPNNEPITPLSFIVDLIRNAVKSSDKVKEMMDDPKVQKFVKEFFQ